MRKLVLLTIFFLGGCSAYSTEPEIPGPELGNIVTEVRVENSPAEGILVILTGLQDQQGFTDSSGMATFSDLPVGLYAVSISEFSSEVSFSETSKFVSVKKEEATNVFFMGELLREAVIAGVVRAGETLLAGVELTLNDSTNIITDSGGGYSFTGLGIGDYLVTMINPDEGIYNFSTIEQSVEIEDPRGRYDLDFVGELINLNTASIEIVVRVDNLLAQGIIVALAGASAKVTDENGEVNFTNLPAGDYVATISGFSSDVSFPRVSKSLRLGQGENATLVFEGETNVSATATIEGRVFLDLNGNAVYDEGVDTPFVGLLVTLSSSEVRSVVTDSFGWYKFVDVDFGSWAVSITNPDSNLYSFDATEIGIAIGGPDTFVHNFIAVSIG